RAPILFLKRIFDLLVCDSLLQAGSSATGVPAWMRAFFLGGFGWTGSFPADPADAAAGTAAPVTARRAGRRPGPPDVIACRCERAATGDVLLRRAGKGARRARGACRRRQPRADRRDPARRRLVGPRRGPRSRLSAADAPRPP